MAHLGRIESLIEMLGSEPEDLFLNYALGIEYTTISDFTQAERQFKKVIGLDASYIAAYYQMGKLLEMQAKTKEALECYHTGLEKARLKKDNKAINEFGEAIFMLED